MEYEELIAQTDDIQCWNAGVEVFKNDHPEALAPILKVDDFQMLSDLYMEFYEYPRFRMKKVVFHIPVFWDEIVNEMKGKRREAFPPIPVFAAFNRYRHEILNIVSQKLAELDVDENDDDDPDE